MFSLLYSLTNAGKQILSDLSRAGPRPQGLLGLPTEILLLIMKELEWDDVIRLRTTCKTLRAPTHSKELWTYLFCRYLVSALPTPFILPKSLSECSSTDIERIVWKSQASLSIPHPLQADKSHPFNIPNTEITRLHLVPGGRWLLAGCEDGSVWWFDLDSYLSPGAKSSGAGGPNLLLESPLLGNEASENDASVIFSIDYTSESSGANIKSQFQTLEQFNLAVAVTYLSPNLDYSKNSFQVWRVNIASNGPSAGIKAHECLSSFFEDVKCSIVSISLYGVDLAYCLALPRHITVIVDWRVVNGKQADLDSGFMRWYLRPAAGRRVFLLPGDLLLLLSPTVEYVRLWKWRQSAAYSDLSPSRAWNLEPEDPFWQYELLCWPRNVGDILPPVKVDGNYQCAIPTSERGVFLLSIPEENPNLSSITCRHVFTGDLSEPKERCSPFGFRYCLIFERKSGWKLMPYQEDPILESITIDSRYTRITSNSSNSSDIVNPLQVVLDQYTHRIVVSNRNRFFVADLTLSSA